jgi:hypothetical protein
MGRFDCIYNVDNAAVRIYVYNIHMYRECMHDIFKPLIVMKTFLIKRYRNLEALIVTFVFIEYYTL